MKKVVIGVRQQEEIILIDSFGIGQIPSEIYKIYKNFKIITNIFQIQHISSILCGLYSILFILCDIKNKNDFINFFTLFNKNDFIKNELILYINI